MATRKDIADIVFPDIKETIEDLGKKFPPRSNPICSRYAPSPTGFVHIGNIYASLVESQFAHQNWWTFFLRIEDTDQKRLTEWWIDIIINWFKKFWIEIDEWPILPGNWDVWSYWPYIQSKRKYFYEVFVKELISKWLAYPCRMTEDEINQIRENQTKSKLVPWIYWKFSLRRDKSMDEILDKLKAESGKYQVIRFRSPGDLTKKIVFHDEIRWDVNMIDNYNDVVLIKWDWLPTYHMAHVVDDHLMRVSHVIRAEEWLTSVPLHLQLFGACGLQHPKYCHPAQILKLDDGNKRKLSKRKDPEADVEFFFERWYPVQWIIEYLMWIISSEFEWWQIANPDKSYRDFEISFDKMNHAWALFDLVKLNSVCNNYISRISTDELYENALNWAKQYNPHFADLMESDIEYTKAAINIERHTSKDPKRFTIFKDVEAQILFFYDSEREKLVSDAPILSEIFTKDLIDRFVADYSKKLDLNMTTEDWFNQLKEIWKQFWFAVNNAEFKEWWYIWKIWDLAMFLRIQLCCASQTPDLFSVMKVMGKERVINRLSK